MRTELSADRLRRLDMTSRSDADGGESDDDGEQDHSLSRWLPAAAPDNGPAWLAAIRADPGRAGLYALAAVAVIAVMVTVFMMMRDPVPPVVSAKLPPVQMASSAAPKPSSSVSPGPQEPVVVSVVGLVH